MIQFTLCCALCSAMSSAIQCFAMNSTAVHCFVFVFTLFCLKCNLVPQELIGEEGM